jgi:hypothetical protein
MSNVVADQEGGPIATGSWCYHWVEDKFGGWKVGPTKCVAISCNIVKGRNLTISPSYVQAGAGSFTPNRLWLFSGLEFTHGDFSYVEFLALQNTLETFMYPTWKERGRGRNRASSNPSISKDSLASLGSFPVRAAECGGTRCLDWVREHFVGRDSCWLFLLGSAG